MLRRPAGEESRSTRGRVAGKNNRKAFITRMGISNRLKMLLMLIARLDASARYFSLPGLWLQSGWVKREWKDDCCCRSNRQYRKSGGEGACGTGSKSDLYCAEPEQGARGPRGRGEGSGRGTDGPCRAGKGPARRDERIRCNRSQPADGRPAEQCPGCRSQCGGQVSGARLGWPRGGRRECRIGRRPRPSCDRGKAAWQRDRLGHLASRLIHAERLRAGSADQERKQGGATDDQGFAERVHRFARSLRAGVADLV